MFASLVAQSENLGDLVIRRNAITHACPGRPVVALTTGMPKAYLEAFELPEGSVLVDSAARFQWLLLIDSLRRRSHLLIAPGPMVLSNKPLRLLKAIVLLGNSVLVRLSGGRVMSLGRSYRGAHGLVSVVEKFQRKVSSLYFVRDFESRAWVGSGAQIRPDMAFAGELALHDEARDVISVSVRNAGPQLVGQLSALKGYARERSLKIVLVTQVKFDEEVHAKLAESLGISHVSWGDRDHSDQLREVAEIYSRSIAVVSNRLHALIFGLQFGAVAVPVGAGKHPKLISTLDGRVPFCELETLLADPSSFLDALASLQPGSVSGWKKANAELMTALSQVP
ncbi:polysaccharide pyruvyl transferase family protein [Kocuria sp. M1N1S27]|uniref:polysaccharide pyruvyl transferase family protein n=1 Tax=Kocuria kalidii TaxID=3376283 RepID=UPI0037919803